MTEIHDTLPGGSTAPADSPPPSGPARLVRLTDQKKVSGVAAGLGYYFGIDPTLVRVAFAVTGLLSFGAAVAVYAVLWWLLPASTAAESGLPTPPPGAGRNHGFQVAAVVIGVVMLSQLHWVSGQVIVAMVLIGVGLLLFNDGTGPTPLDAASRWVRRTFASSATSTPPPPAHQPPPPPSHEQPPPSNQQPPSWQPSPPTSAYQHPYQGAYTRTVPQPPVRRPKRDRSALGALTLAVWLLAMGGAAVANGLGMLTLTFPRVAALTVMVAGLGLLVGSVVGRARGLIAIGLHGSLMWVISTAAVQVDIGVPLEGGVGERNYSPTAVEQIRDYRLTAGELVVDLTELDLNGATVPVAASVALGELRVMVPDDVTVRVSGSLGAGDYTIFDATDSGTRLAFDVEDAAPEGAGVLALELQGGAGQITVTREDPQ